MPEWLKGADCKSAGFAYAGSNPALSTIFRLQVIVSERIIAIEFGVPLVFTLVISLDLCGLWWIDTRRSKREHSYQLWR